MPEDGDHSQPGLMHHFRGKEELLIAALERRDAESSGHMEETFRGSSAVDAIVSLCRHNMALPGPRVLPAPLDVSAFRHRAGGWAVEPGTFDVHPGLSATDIHGTTTVEVPLADRLRQRGGRPRGRLS